MAINETEAPVNTINHSNNGLFVGIAPPVGEQKTALQPPVNDFQRLINPLIVRFRRFLSNTGAVTLFDGMVKAGMFGGIEVTEPVTELQLPYYTLQVRARMVELWIGGYQLQFFWRFLAAFFP